VSDPAAHAVVTKSLENWQQTPGTSLQSSVVDYVENRADLLKQLEEFRPNIVHILCHGIADLLPRLEVESRNDRRRVLNRGTIELRPADFANLTSIKCLWLMVLNCCQGATPATNLHSIARDLVVSGAPVVIAMRESVDVVDANLFTSAFYHSLLPELVKNVIEFVRDGGPAPHAIDQLTWLSPMFYARQRLSTDAGPAESSPKWTFPVAYVHRDALQIYATSGDQASASYRKQKSALDFLETVRSYLLESSDDDMAAKSSLARLDVELARVRNRLIAPAEK
jgi:hypothetical protein